jgi:hypothetical protein
VIFDNRIGMTAMTEKMAGVQIRLMGDDDAVRLVAEALERTGLVSITGTAPMRGGHGLRAYGVGIVATAQSQELETA